MVSEQESCNYYLFSILTQIHQTAFFILDSSSQKKKKTVEKTVTPRQLRTEMSSKKKQSRTSPSTARPHAGLIYRSYAPSFPISPENLLRVAVVVASRPILGGSSPPDPNNKKPRDSAWRRCEETRSVKRVGPVAAEESSPAPTSSEKDQRSFFAINRRVVRLFSNRNHGWFSGLRLTTLLYKCRC